MVIYAHIVAEPTRTFEEWQALMDSERVTPRRAGPAISAEMITMEDAEFEMGLRSQMNRVGHAQRKSRNNQGRNYSGM